ncbi:MAG: excinuclease ABC subunit UvrC [Bacteroidales bacterium]|jgi:excinuclease ABC subunit C|nr:excinuclease ABC subunit UvrC [Bacteroidales bacterium]
MDNINKPAFDSKLAITLKTLPNTPGIYQFIDKDGVVIYVGKAKNLKSRVGSYFHKDYTLSDKTRMLIRRICDVKLIHVNDETEALLLENNLIKQLKPRYNIMLKDDKAYPWLKITNEPFPRIVKTRIVSKDGGKYFGPYPKGNVLSEIQNLIRTLFKYRSCTLPLTEETINQGKYKACLDFQIHLCEAPCNGNQNREDYNEVFNQIKQVLSGNFQQLITSLTENMMRLANQMKFEEAHEVKKQVAALENYRNKTAVVSSRIRNVEVYSYIEGDGRIYFNALKVVNGCIISSYSTEVAGKIDETSDDIFLTAIVQTRHKFNYNADEIIVPKRLDLPQDYVKQTTPHRDTTEKYKLLQLSLHNARYEKNDRIKRATLIDPERWSMKTVEQMQKDLHLAVLPKHIECFDNSNIQGNYPVASCVVFRNCKPSNKEYKHFNIKTVVGSDDFASMKEIIYRRYSRLKREDKPLPQLIVIDGGKGQLSAAVESLTALGLADKITVIGIAKRLEEIFFPNDPHPLCLDKRSASLKVIQHIRDEAHRFGITFHRNKRSKATIRTQLTDIKGIGNAISRKLLLKFSSVKCIQDATFAQLEECIGKSKAEIVFRHFNPDKIIP